MKGDQVRIGLSEGGTRLIDGFADKNATVQTYTLTNSTPADRMTHTMNGVWQNRLDEIKLDYIKKVSIFNQFYFKKIIFFLGVFLYFFIISYNFCHASVYDRNFFACNSYIQKTGKAVDNEKWRTDKIDNEIKKIIDGYITEDDSVSKWVVKKNLNKTKTIVIEINNSEQELYDWIVLYKNDNNTELKKFVYAAGFSFSKNSSGGVFGLFFCTKNGLSHEWVWQGSNWEVR